MDKLFFEYMTGKIHETTNTRRNIHIFSNGKTLKGPSIYYFFNAVDKFKNVKVTTSIRDAKLNNVPYWLADRGCRNGHAPIRDLNNNCVECEYIKKNKKLDGRATITTRMMFDYPDMILDYETAKTLDFKVYRTGEPCWQGHTDYRYVRNKTCVICSRSHG